ncbi:3-keto-disaccharide hydrolase [Erythrobacter sp. BLCC-B19]|uniref:3-keto-disaccharide hydrolase n=1 Tax=Erythrobacter sp. BLCC-B19 TaxID=3025315 RepID=UPI00235FD5E3|nr:DUF1080 domain-containing protein [Erythrobacter sp. BLCC-B19]WDA41303.1 DUF1080 domain-containing protein [Erythrobacter sp. BLCC-B19]
MAATAASGSGDAGRSLTDELRARDPAIRQLIDENPGIEEGWQEPFWREALLDAPRLPGSPWRIHDLARPQPPLVAPSECQKARGRKLKASDWTGEKLALWSRDGGELVPSGHTANRIATRESFGDVELSLEFQMPAPPVGVFQRRGNSGIFFQQRYEVQILDSHRNPTYPDGQMGALYGQVPPRANASRPPGEWQCLTIRYRAARFADDGALIAPPRASVALNGVMLQDDQAFLGPTAFAAVGPWQPHAVRLPIVLQDHGDAGGRIRFRNIRVRELPAQ